MNAPGPGVFADPCAARLLQAHPEPRRALFLDRDGVINVDRAYVHRREDNEWVNGIFELCGMALDDLPHGDSFSLENDFLAPRVSGGEPVAAFFETSGFIDIGVPEHYALAQRIFGTAES